MTETQKKNPILNYTGLVVGGSVASSLLIAAVNGRNPAPVPEPVPHVQQFSADSQSEEKPGLPKSGPYIVKVGEKKPVVGKATEALAEKQHATVRAAGK